jgi:hypothetical protein
VGAEGEIGKIAATPADVNASLESLHKEPPKKFDVARIERVYSSKIQFVELELTGYKLSSKKISIPNDLLIGDDQALNEKLKNSFQLLGVDSLPKVSIPKFDIKTLLPIVTHEKPEMEKWDEKQLEKEKKRLYDDFLINVPGYGWVIMSRLLEKFELRVKLFKLQVCAYQKEVETNIQSSLDKALDDLVSILLPRLRDYMPERLTKFHHAKLDDSDLKGILKTELTKVVGGVSGIFSPSMTCLQKAVTYQSINDKVFLDLLGAAMRKNGADSQANNLFTEFDAAPELQPAVD